MRRLRLIWPVYFGIIVLICFLLAFRFFGRQPKYSGRETILVVDNPVLIWSMSSDRKSSLVIKLPPELVIESMHGFGPYSLASLWRLGSLEKKVGPELLAQSVEEAIGLPINYYIGSNQELSENSVNNSDQSALRGKIISRLWPSQPGLVHNLSWRKAWEFFWILNQQPVTSFTSIDISKTTALMTENLPDGSSRQIIDPKRLDFLLGQQLEDEKIRQERLSIGIYNTTNTLSLASRAARILGRIGALVVTVANSNPEISECELVGGKDQLASYTALEVARIFSCTTRVGENERVDLQIRLGTGYASRFTP